MEGVWGVVGGAVEGTGQRGVGRHISLMVQ